MGVGTITRFLCTSSCASFPSTFSLIALSSIVVHIIVTSEGDVNVDLILMNKLLYYCVPPCLNFAVYVSSIWSYMLPCPSSELLLSLMYNMFNQVLATGWFVISLQKSLCVCIYAPWLLIITH